MFTSSMHWPVGTSWQCLSGHSRACSVEFTTFQSVSFAVSVSGSKISICHVLHYFSREYSAAKGLTMSYSCIISRTVQIDYITDHHLNFILTDSCEHCHSTTGPMSRHKGEPLS